MNDLYNIHAQIFVKLLYINFFFTHEVILYCVLNLVVIIM